MKYRVKGVVEAVQFTGSAPLPDGVRKMGPEKFYLSTPIEGADGGILHVGDYICQGEDGHRWPSAAALFEATYERAPG